MFERHIYSTWEVETEKEIRSFLSFIELGIEIYQQFLKKVFENQQIYKQMTIGVQKLLANLYETANSYTEKKIELNLKDQKINSYEELADFCNNNICEFKGMIDSINRVFEMSKYKSTLITKIEAEKAKIEKLKTGKKTIFQLFNRKTNDHYINTSDNEIRNLENLLASIESILNISSAIVTKEIIPEFKLSKFMALKVNIGAFCEKSENAIESLIDQFRDFEARI